MKVYVKSARFQVPWTGRFVQILRDWMTTRFSTMLDNGTVVTHIPRALEIGWNPEKNPTGSYPDTFPLPGAKPNDFVALDEPWQRRWLECLDQASGFQFDDLLTRWGWLTQHGIAFTDLHARQNGFTDYILQENLVGSKGPIQVKSLTTGGNICKVVAETDTHYLIEALDPLHTPPPSVDELLEKRWLLQIATQTTKDYHSLAFPQLGGFDVPFFLVSLNGVNRIPIEWTRPIANGAWFDPYYEN